MNRKFLLLVVLTLCFFGCSSAANADIGPYLSEVDHQNPVVYVAAPFPIETEVGIGFGQVLLIAYREDDYTMYRFYINQDPFSGNLNLCKGRVDDDPYDDSYPVAFCQEFSIWNDFESHLVDDRAYLIFEGDLDYVVEGQEEEIPEWRVLHLIFGEKLKLLSGDGRVMYFSSGWSDESQVDMICVEYLGRMSCSSGSGGVGIGDKFTYRAWVTDGWVKFAYPPNWSIVIP